MQTDTTQKPILTVRIASPRGFCAGVVRAIETVESALAEFGAPVYVRHEIVHNNHVLKRLRAMGAVFIDELSEAPGDRPVVLSAHGAPKSVYEEADVRGLIAFDATCPLVLKVHNQIRRYVAEGRHVILIGHAGHPEIIGALGQTPAGTVSLIETVVEAETAELPDGPLAYATQTTLSLADTADIINALKARRPDIKEPRSADICYATTNRQNAVMATAPGCDLFLVVGAPQSSNSVRLVETALSADAKAAELVDDPAQFDVSRLQGAEIIGVSAGASAPEELVEDLLARIANTRTLKLEHVNIVEEDVHFKQPVRRAS